MAEQTEPTDAAPAARFGIDVCCGGELPLAVAAEHHGVDLDRLLDALARADGSG